MLATRMLVVLTGPLDVGSVVRTAAAAVKAAARPYGLRFAAPQAFESAVEDMLPAQQQEMAFIAKKGRNAS